MLFGFPTQFIKIVAKKIFASSDHSPVVIVRPVVAFYFPSGVRNHRNTSWPGRHRAGWHHIQESRYPPCCTLPRYRWPRSPGHMDRTLIRW